MKEVLSRTVSTFLLLTIIWKEFKCAEIWTCKIEDSHHFSDSLPEDIIGTWYEISRYPSEEKSNRVEVMVASLPEDGDQDANVLLQIKYKNSRWKPLKPNLRFPWDDWTKEGEFVFHKTPPTLDAKAMYKLIGISHDKDYISACIYTSKTNTSELKFLGRKPNRNEPMEKVLLHSLRLPFDVENTSGNAWIYEGDKCKSSASALTGILTVYLLSLSVNKFV
uniref:Lipocalin/cytosolic fatty-acid binding domain-containing protein n=1 Tax=Glossina morsitans morsitans TaxID=37546 RepID=A0A1B0GDP0_GLOMM